MLLGDVFVAKANNLAERIILFLVFFVFALLVVAFAFGWDNLLGNESEGNASVSEFQYVTVSKSEKADDTVTGSGSTTSILININTATVSELDALPGIGEKKAQAIVDYRMENGPFEAIDGIKEVSGIGDGIFEKIRSYITVE